jgi:hypothetical protein
MLRLVALVYFGGTVRDLGHDDYLVREAAQSRLSRAPAPLWLGLVRRHPDLEVRRRGLAAAAPYLDVGRCRPLHEVLGLGTYEFWWHGDVAAYERAGIKVSWAAIGRLAPVSLSHPASPLWRRYSAPYRVRDAAEGFVMDEGPLRGRPIGPNYPVRTSPLMTAALARDLLLAGVPRAPVQWWLGARAPRP